MSALPGHELVEAGLDDLRRGRWSAEAYVVLEARTRLRQLPELPGWRERSPFLFREGVIDVFHLDFASQALAKLERGFEQDLADVDSMVAARVVDPDELSRLFALIEDELFRFPAVDPPSLRAAVLGLASRPENGLRHETPS